MSKGLRLTREARNDVRRLEWVGVPDVPQAVISDAVVVGEQHVFPWNSSAHISPKR